MRYLSFRFDDGFLKGAQTAARLLAPDRGSFFVITSLIEEGSDTSENEFLRGGNFGSFSDWQELANAGQDVQPHSVQHLNLQELSEQEQVKEITGSLDFVRKIHDGPFVFCAPYNRRVDLDFKALGLDGAGFRTSRYPRSPLINDLADFDRFELNAWVVFESEVVRVLEDLENIPDETWTILAFHSLDGEGHQPWTSTQFSKLVAAVRDGGFSIETVADMIGRFATPDPGA